MAYWLVLLCACSSTCAYAQSPEQPQAIPPTSYVFGHPLATVRTSARAQLQARPGFRYMRLRACSPGGMEEPAARDTSSLCLVYSGPIGSSVRYVNQRGAPLPYYADFRLRFTPLGPAQTRVDVLTLHPRVVTGVALLPSLPHFVRQERTTPVAPSGWEEYELLQLLGRGLHEPHMPTAPPLPAPTRIGR
ncbi:hypothetical protein I2I05_20995 [Hymenobacter sp. BT683]|uniref:Uncharacterized protein n=1 Tax=Hymenobacter jeongseonensis TaxID=2791027 RepID=A0ABS0IND0_9BACT|nr:hypothetical protein [Hymenobacter jeongseonensis]MBF9239882.1 hypothetical protein [Hymenobacter jeongseonensis]